MRVVVIIPAAGLGTRMAAHSGARPGQTTKQFAEIAGKPILLHTLEKFAHVSEVTDIYIAVRENEVDRLRDFLTAQHLRPKMHVVIGGDNRQQSVANALATVEGAATDVVLVHDAVRPFVDGEVIENVIEAAGKHGAAIAGLPAVDTIKQVERTADGAITVGECHWVAGCPHPAARSSIHGHAGSLSRRGRPVRMPVWRSKRNTFPPRSLRRQNSR